MIELIDRQLLDIVALGSNPRSSWTLVFICVLRHCCRLTTCVSDYHDEISPFSTVLISFTLIILESCTVSGDTIGEYLCENQPPNTKLQHPEHCDVYLVCDNNRAIEMKCPSGIMFNPRTNECDPQFKNCPANAGHRGDGSDYDEDDDEDDNDDEGDGEEDEEDEPNEEEPDNEDDEAEEKVEENDDEDDESPAVVKPPKQNPPAASETSGCPKVDTDQITFLMHKTDCSLYFLCYHGKPIPFQCSMGMHWSNEQKKCVPKEVSECGVSCLEVSINPIFRKILKLRMHSHLSLILSQEPQSRYNIVCRIAPKSVSLATRKKELCLPKTFSVLG